MGCCMAFNRDLLKYVLPFPKSIAMHDLWIGLNAEVYGNPLEHPQKETYWGNVNPNGIRSCYDEGKRAAETFMMDYHRENKVDIRIARIFNTYGPRMRLNDGRVVPQFFYQALNGKELTLHGGGKQTRSFCFVSDLVAGVIKYYESYLHQPVNIGNPLEVSIKEFAQRILKTTGAQSKLIDTEARPDDPRRR